MSCLFEPNDVFTFTWQIENFTMCAQTRGHCLKSPAFVVDGLQKSSWELNLYPRGDKDNEYISLYLKRCGGAQTCENKIRLGYTLELDSIYPSKRPSKADIKCEFAIGESYGFPTLVKRSAILEDFTGNVLTARCSMWLQYKEDNVNEMLEGKRTSSEHNLSLENIKNLDDMKEMPTATNHDLAAFKYRFAPNECCARTQIKVERMSIVCPLANFCKDKSKKSFLTIMSAMNSPSFILTFEKADFNDWMIIKIIRIADINSQHFVKGKITAFHSEKSSVLFEDDYYLFEAGVQNDEWKFVYFIKKSIFNELNLFCEFAISTQGNETHTSENKIVVECKTNKLNIKTFSGLGNNYHDFYKCPSLPDVVLTCDKHIYHVHEDILLAKSKLFKDLLKDEDEDSLDIEDLKPNVLKEMLEFMYHVEIPDLKEKASDLYFAAHKYQIESLKQKCSSVLKSELSVSNVCKNLTLADEYKDFDLFLEIQKFIHKNAKEVFESSEWLDLSEKNPILALNMSQKVLKQNMNI